MAILPGNNSAVPFSIGQGVNPVTLSSRGQAVQDFPLVSQAGNGVAGQTTEFRVLEITTITQLRESLNISSSHALKFLNTDFSGSLSFARSIEKNNQSRYLMVHTRVTNELELADRDQLIYRESVQDFLRNPQNTASDFEENFGTEFVSGRRTGGQFYAVVQFEFSSAAEERNFNTALEVTKFGFQASGRVNQELSKFNQTARTQVYMFKEGGAPGLPNIENVLDYALKFDEVVQGLRGSPVTLELITSDYTGVEPIDLRRNPELLERQKTVMKRLAENRDTAVEMLNSIRYISDNLSEYDFDPAIHTFQQWEEELNIYINTMNDAAVDCFSDIFNNCRLPDNAFPSINLPKRIARLGLLWLEQEGDWRGRWTRRENSDLFDAIWSHPTENNVTAELKITRNGNNIVVIRTNSSDDNNCAYTGTVSDDGRSVTGTYTCDRGGGNWNATIN